MELGNLIFGNSRGEFPIERDAGFEEQWRRLTEAACIEWYGFPEDGCGLTHDAERGWYENDVFRVMPYYWGDDPDKAMLPNFLFKPTGFEINWYKYPFRDSYMNRDITPVEFAEIIDACVRSVKK
jgi:hypothetical protein